MVWTYTKNKQTLQDRKRFREGEDQGGRKIYGLTTSASGQERTFIQPRGLCMIVTGEGTKAKARLTGFKNESYNLWHAFFQRKGDKWMCYIKAQID